MHYNSNYLYNDKNKKQLLLLTYNSIHHHEITNNACLNLLISYYSLTSHKNEHAHIHYIGSWFFVVKIPSTHSYTNRYYFSYICPNE